MKTPIKIIIVITVVLVIFGIFLFSGDDNSVRFADYGEAPFVFKEKGVGYKLICAGVVICGIVLSVAL